MYKIHILFYSYFFLNHFSIAEMHKMAHITLYTHPKPPAPILLVLEKLLVAVAIVSMSNKGNSKVSLLSWSVKWDNLEAALKALTPAFLSIKSSTWISMHTCSSCFFLL